LFFIAFYYMNPDNNEFPFNVQVVEDFKHYTELVSGRKLPDNTISKALQKLIVNNIVVKFRNGVYRINPLMTGAGNQYHRRKIINEYSQTLTKKGKDPMSDYFPKYKSLT
jgi:hypothetical protein